MASDRRPPAPLARFLELFEDGRHWDSHEALEDAWRRRDSGFYHGLILYASAFVHARRGNRHGVLAQLEKARRALDSYRPVYLGLDVDAILDHARRCREVVEPREAPPEGSEAGWLGLLDEPPTGWSADRVRGDEPELSPDPGNTGG